MTLMHEQFFDEAARDRHQGGWQAAVEKMETYLASQ
jgi:quinol monooxygenase YgiN